MLPRFGSDLLADDCHSVQPPSLTANAGVKRTIDMPLQRPETVVDVEFRIERLSVLAYSSGFTLWLYRASGEMEAILSNPRFFEAAGDVFAAGDMIMVSARGGSRVLSVMMDEAGVQIVSSI